MHKIYILHSGTEIIEDAVNLSKYKNNIVTINPALKSKNFRILRKIHLIIGIKSHLWIDLMLKDYSIKDNKNTTLIIFDSPIWIMNIKYIRNKYKNVKIVFWFWNIVKNKYINKIEIIRKNVDSINTFDDRDALKFNFIHNPQFYWILHNKESDIKYDVLFVGKNKNRIELLEKIYIKLTSLGLKCYFYILEDSNSDYSTIFKLYSKALTYSEVLNLISQSTSILDVNQNNQSGLTLRVLESLFLKKKLLTNNMNIISYDFFKKNNIQIIEDDLDIDVSFFFKCYEKVDNEIIEKYTFDRWIEKLSGISKDADKL